MLRRTVLMLALGVLACDEGSPVIVETPPRETVETPRCPPFDDNLRTRAVARPAVGKTARAVSRDGYVYGAAGADGAYIADIIDPSRVRIIRTFPQLTDARDVAATDRLLYVADGTNGLAVANISDPVHATVTGALSLPGAAVDVAAAGTRGYVINDLLGLVIVDASNAAQPRVLGIENTPGNAVAVAVDGTLAFVADQTDGLRVVNVADPAAPFILARLAVPGVARGVAVHNSLVAVAAGSAGLQLVDVSDPTQPSIVSALPTSDDAVGAALGDGVAYVAVGRGGMDVANVALPSSPLRIQTVGTAARTVDVTLDGNRPTVAEDVAGARVFEVRTLELPSYTALDGITAFAAAPMGDLLVLAETSGRVSVVDPSQHSLVGRISLFAYPSDIAVEDSVAYIPTGNGCMVVDLHRPWAPTVQQRIPFALDVVAVDGPSLFQAGGLSSFLVEYALDGSFQARSLTLTGSWLTAMEVDDDHVYLADRYGYLRVAVRSNFTTYYTIPMRDDAEDVVVRYEDGPRGPGTRRTAYVAVVGVVTGLASVDCIDLSDLASPVLLWRADCGGNAVGVDVMGSRMVVAEGADGCEMFSIGATGAFPLGYGFWNTLGATFGGGHMVFFRQNYGIGIIALDDCPP